MKRLRWTARNVAIEGGGRGPNDRLLALAVDLVAGGDRLARSGDQEGTARDEDGSGSGLANFLRMRCRLEGAVSVLGPGLATIWLNSGGRVWRRVPVFKAAPVCFLAGPGDGNPWVI